MCHILNNLKECLGLWCLICWRSWNNLKASNVLCFQEVDRISSVLHFEEFKGKYGPWCFIFRTSLKNVGIHVFYILKKLKNFGPTGVLYAEDVKRISRFLVFYILKELIESQGPWFFFRISWKNVGAPVIYILKKLKEPWGHWCFICWRCWKNLEISGV